jgi:hypothetical protein
MEPNFKDIIVAKLKARGLNIAEDAAGEAVKALFEAIQEYVTSSPNKYDDLSLAVLPAVQAMVLKEVDKIDGVIAG